MILLFTFLICFASCIVGAICGIGGGVIIKPVLDAVGAMEIAAINFLSGCTVLSMTAYSVLRSRTGGKSRIDMAVGTPLAIGAALGGVAGKQLFDILRAAFQGSGLHVTQSACLLLITLGTLIYTVNKDRVKTKQVENKGACCLIGLALGLMSAFLGIGGGPINLVVLFYFFSMDTKTAAENSLYIILFSQVASLILSIVTGTVPTFSPLMLGLMVGGGILGGVCGRRINKKIDSAVVDKLFIALMALIILINIFNIVKFL